MKTMQRVATITQPFMLIGLVLLAGVLLFKGTHPDPVYAAHNPKLTNVAANAEADAICALLNGGFLDIYDGSQPATGDTAIGAQVKLAGLTLNATACGAASSAVATFNSITSDTDADATGTAAWARMFKTDHTTAVMDISVGTSGADLNLTTVAISQHATVSVTALTFTAGKG